MGGRDSAPTDEAVKAIDDRHMAASLRLLVAASRELATSFDYAQTLAAVGRLVVPAFADGFSVEVDEGEIRTTLARAGRIARDSRSFALVARGKHMGCMRISGAAPASDASSGLDVWDELALRVAVSVDAAQVYAREHHVADTLQRALLPERLPVDDRLVFDAAYLPGAQEAIVGGDWYDAFRLPDGRIAFSIGDVAGHGLRAAIVMGEVRQAFRAAALNPNSPSLVLERANTIVNMRANPVMVTAIFGIVDPSESTVTYACAGHPAPVLALPGGSVLLLPKDGVPLGIIDQVDATDWTFTIPPGGLFTVYTDGLIEYSRDVVAGERRLLDAVREGIALKESEPARGLVQRVFAAGGNTDDVATLTVSAADVRSTSFAFTFTALPMAVSLVRRSLERFAHTLGLDEEGRFSLLTACGEAIANAVEHAYLGPPGLVHVRAHVHDDTLLVTIEDEGKWKPAQRREERGRGLKLMRALMDGVEIRTDQSRTEVRLKMALSERRIPA
ncbi:MAG: protein serine/threonine phosphatase [Candidatus Eremiobacteraeota bacterium]|nr:protein serine/threonine phosphatase [Candidatus Eremiobacteraeota bacterium]